MYVSFNLQSNHYIIVILLINDRIGSLFIFAPKTQAQPLCATISKKDVLFYLNPEDSTGNNRSKFQGNQFQFSIRKT